MAGFDVYFNTTTGRPRKFFADRHEAISWAVLASWVNGAKENHDALGHRGEPVGEECWTRFHAGDITNMIDDAAHQVGIHGYQPKGS